MRLPRATAPDASPAAHAAHAAAVLAACGVEPGTLLHSGEIVDVIRGFVGRPRARFAGLRSGDLGAEPRSGDSCASPLRAEAAPLPVAVKLTRERWRGHPGAIELVAREHRVLASVDHPHIVRAHGFAERTGVAALVTELLPGGDLVPLVGGPPQQWVAAARAVAAALAAVHAAGFVHGDVKARNVLFDASGRAKLIDFGSARPIGSPRARGGRTRAHEILRFDVARASPVEDAYAFAVLLYELMSGRLPFGPEPARWSPPAPLDAGSGRALDALAARVTATLHAERPEGVVTLIELADVLESVHAEAARGPVDG
ncbi:MAG TPA: protein kinase [Gammaproteobacteria bacterium]